MSEEEDEALAVLQQQEQEQLHQREQLISKNQCALRIMLILEVAADTGVANMRYTKRDTANCCHRCEVPAELVRWPTYLDLVSVFSSGLSMEPSLRCKSAY